MKTTQGKPLIKSNVPYVLQLEYDEDGREAVKKVLTDYRGTRAALDTFNIENKGPVRGSNIYARFALGNAYREVTGENVRPITPRESEIALANDALVDPTSTYEDLGLTVYPNKGVNEKLWQNLREQIKSNFPNVILNKPFIITGLANVVKNPSLEYELGLELNELTEVYNVPILTRDTGNFSSDDEGLQKTGFPGKLGKGNRTLYTAKDSVRRFYRNRNLNLNAGSVGLANSGDDGRVNVAKNFSIGNLDELVARLEQERLKEQESLNQRFEKAKKVLLNR